MGEEDEELDELDLEYMLDDLRETYQEALLKGVTQATLEAYVKAAQDLNTARVKAGLEPLPIDEKQLTEDALRQVEVWYSDLVHKGGSNVVVDHVYLEFKPWLFDLEDNITAELKEIYKNVQTPIEIDNILPKLESKFNDYAETAAFCEIYRQVDEARKSVWGYEKVVRHASGSNICPYCDELDGQIFPADDCPPCPSHPRCKCDYEPIFI
jgi:hypothetical protein